MRAFDYLVALARHCRDAETLAAFTGCDIAEARQAMRAAAAQRRHPEGGFQPDGRIRMRQRAAERVEEAA
jgi:hypothetical protein